MEHTMQTIIYVVTYYNFTNDTQSIEVFSCKDSAREFIHDTCRSFFAIDFFCHPDDLQEAVKNLLIAEFTITEKPITINLPQE
jgi:hypothetical protein